MLGVVILGATALAELLGDGTFAQYVSQMINPKVVPFLFVITMLISKLARNRTLT